MERIKWIDFLRGISMLMILLFHTEVYYKDYDVTPYHIYTTNAIILFYFISGYLFYRHKQFCLKKKIISIVKSLIKPYFIFTTLIAAPKLFIRQETINWQEIVINILCGRASWFIAALIVAELLFSISLWISHGKNKWLIILAITCFITYYIIPFNQHNYWQWQDALLAFVFIWLGYVFHQYHSFFRTMSKPLYSLLLLFILIQIKIYEYHIELPMRNIAVQNIPLFLLDASVWLMFIISTINYIPRCKIIEWTGVHCIIYYFFCGGVPLITSLLLNKIGFPYDGFIYRYLIAVIIVYIMITAITWFIYKYLPVLTGKKGYA